MRYLLSTGLLLLLKYGSALLWRHEVAWVGDTPLPGDRWKGVRLLVILNHTSLYEPVYAALPPARFFRDLARHGVVPIAEKTLRRPLVGRFFGSVAAHVVPLSRQRDHTWHTLLEKVDDPESMMILLPEGRMMRRDGMDSRGNPMTVRGGIADILETMDRGRLLFAYSGGLHHVQAPGEGLPRLFRTVRMNLEVVDLVDYREARRREAADPRHGDKAAVVAARERRRNRHCPVIPGESVPAWPPPGAEGRRGEQRREGGAARDEAGGKG